MMILGAVLILGGLQLFSIGLLGELLVRYFHQRMVGTWNLKVLTRRRRRIGGRGAIHQRSGAPHLQRG